MRYFVNKEDYIAIVHYFGQKNVVANFNDKLARRLGRTFGWNIELKQEIVKKPSQNGVKEKAMSDVLPRNKPKTEDLKLHTFSKDNIYIWDGTNSCEEAQMLRARGFNIIGTSLRAEALEMDRFAGKETMEKLGIPVPYYDIAFTVEELKNILEKFGSKWCVVKFNFNAWQTLVGEGDELAEIIEENQEEIEEGFQGAIVEEYKSGKEISCERTLVGKERRLARNLINFTIEAKYFLAGDLGLQTGSELNLVFPSSMVEDFALYSRNPKQVARILRQIEEYLQGTADLQDVEILDINFIVDIERGKVWALEFTPRIGYLGTITFAHILHNNGIAWDEIFEGNIDDNIKGYGFSVRLSVPPYPYHKVFTHKDKELDFEGVELEIRSSGEGEIKIAWDGVEIDEEDNCWRIINSNLGVASNFSLHLNDLLFRRLYEFIDANVDCEGLQYRTDGEDFIRKWLTE